VPVEKVRFKANLVTTDYGDTPVGGELEEEAFILRAQVDFQGSEVFLLSLKYEANLYGWFFYGLFDILNIVLGQCGP
ncbi:MAG: hypothetical protein HOI07_09455, partial [Betaproteobacteria bacterium]|nr:hypothetical protein [Betaproteobacteria bacterium]